MWIYMDFLSFNENPVLELFGVVETKVPFRELVRGSDGEGGREERMRLGSGRRKSVRIYRRAPGSW